MSVVNLCITPLYGGTYNVFRVISMPNRSESFDWGIIQYTILLTVSLAILGQSRRMIQFLKGLDPLFLSVGLLILLHRPSEQRNEK